MAARDLSTIKTAPPNRLPVKTENIGLMKKQLEMQYTTKFQEETNIFHS